MNLFSSCLTFLNSWDMGLHHQDQLLFIKKEEKNLFLKERNLYFFNYGFVVVLIWIVYIFYKFYAYAFLFLNSNVNGFGFNFNIFSITGI